MGSPGVCLQLGQGTDIMVKSGYYQHRQRPVSIDTYNYGVKCKSAMVADLWGNNYVHKPFP